MSKRITSRDVDCPVCDAPKGERCHSAGRHPHPVDYHIGRREIARTFRQIAEAGETLRVVRTAWDRVFGNAEDTHTKAPGSP